MGWEHCCYHSCLNPVLQSHPLGSEARACVCTCPPIMRWLGGKVHPPIPASAPQGPVPGSISGKEAELILLMLSEGAQKWLRSLPYGIESDSSFRKGDPSDGQSSLSPCSAQPFACLISINPCSSLSDRHYY